MCPISEVEENLESSAMTRVGGLPVLNRRAPIAAVVEAFLAARIPKRSTARGYRRNINAAFDILAIECMEHLRPIHLTEYCGLLKADGRGKASHAQALIALRSFLKWAAAMDGHDMRMDTVEYILEVPKVTVVTPHESLNHKEIDAFIRIAKQLGPREHALAVVALGSGVRVAELVALDIRDVRNDASGGTVLHVRQGKGDKDRMIPVLVQVRRVIDRYLDVSHRTRNDLGPLFLAEDRAMGARKNWRLTTKSAGRLVREIAELAGIQKRVSPHALRHTFAFVSYLHKKNPVAIQKLLGHASLNTTMRYLAHLDELDLRTTIPAVLCGGRNTRKPV